MRVYVCSVCVCVCVCVCVRGRVCVCARMSHVVVEDVFGPSCVLVRTVTRPFHRAAVPTIRRFGRPSP